MVEAVTEGWYWSKYLGEGVNGRAVLRGGGYWHGGAVLGEAVNRGAVLGGGG